MEEIWPHLALEPWNGHKTRASHKSRLTPLKFLRPEPNLFPFSGFTIRPVYPNFSINCRAPSIIRARWPGNAHNLCIQDLSQYLQLLMLTWLNWKFRPPELKHCNQDDHLESLAAINKYVLFYKPYFHCKQLSFPTSTDTSPDHPHSPESTTDRLLLFALLVERSDGRIFLHLTHQLFQSLVYPVNILF